MKDSPRRSFINMMAAGSSTLGARPLREPANPRDAFLRADEKAAMFTTKAVLNCLPRDEWGPRQMPVRASFDRVYPDDLQARILRDWTTGYGLP